MSGIAKGAEIGGGISGGPNDGARFDGADGDATGMGTAVGCIAPGTAAIGRASARRVTRAGTGGIALSR